MRVEKAPGMLFAQPRGENSGEGDTQPRALWMGLQDLVHVTINCGSVGRRVVRDFAMGARDLKGTTGSVRQDSVTQRGELGFRQKLFDLTACRIAQQKKSWAIASHLRSQDANPQLP